jgi:hypothetical protein
MSQTGIIICDTGRKLPLRYAIGSVMKNQRQLVTLEARSKHRKLRATTRERQARQQGITRVNISFIGILVLLVAAVVLVLIPIGIVLVVSSVSRRKDDLAINPNLAPCPDCQKLISIHAPMCPHCGRPMKIA